MMHRTSGPVRRVAGKVVAAQPASRAARMTPREAAARSLASERLAQSQSSKKSKYKDPTKIKGFAYGRMTE